MHRMCMSFKMPSVSLHIYACLEKVCMHVLTMLWVLTFAGWRGGEGRGVGGGEYLKYSVAARNVY